MIRILKTCIWTFVLAGFVLYAANYLVLALGWQPFPDSNIGSNIPDEVLGYRLRGTRQVSGGTYINSLGLRGREIETPKDAATLRIVCLGGSTTYGVEVEDHLTWPAILETILNNIGLGHHFEVLNAGLPGYLSGHSRYKLDHELLALKPDIVLVMDGLNDMATAYKKNLTSEAARRHYGQAFVAGNVEHARLLGLLKAARLDVLAGLYWRFLIRSESEEQVKRTIALALAGYAANIEAMAKACQAAGAALYVVNAPWIFNTDRGMPDNWNDLHRDFTIAREDFNILWYGAPLLRSVNDALGRKLGTTVIDVQAAIDAAPDRRSLFVKNDYIHFNKIGNFLIAYGIATVLANRMAPDSGVPLPFVVEKAFPYLLP
ncbi:MAG: SGNH/GDSL hydrolase family protein [Solidesulfovibrio sp. DCME]|uniref:SGNH/GDSL hydrolase family protein n=1 Tax=Solidesulfovibrio sp. DCME TaxID=3447380 RepID=UPI003D140B5E